ncbi:uncharacterized protein LOC135690928 [Rhopilema esculentum]|uniref:uncharacterized protein LOC135690928 n=1 Tax=Rhopilema esculentum TaxID=499914 RepID=UPI0031E44EA1
MAVKEISAADNGNTKKYEEAKQRLQQHDMVVARNMFLEEALEQANAKIEALEKENIALKAEKKTEISLGQSDKCLQTDILDKEPRENYHGTDFKSRDEADKYNESVNTKSGNKRRRKRGKKGARKGNVVAAQSETAESSSAKESTSDDLLSEDASIGKSTCAGDKSALDDTDHRIATQAKTESDKSVDAKEPCSATLIPMESDKSAIDAKEPCSATQTPTESGKSAVDAKEPCSATPIPMESDKSAIDAKEPCSATPIPMESDKSAIDAKEPCSATLTPIGSGISAVDAKEPCSATPISMESDKSAIDAKEPCSATLTPMGSGISAVDAKEPCSATPISMESDKSAIDANEQAGITQATRKSGRDSNENSGSEIIKKSNIKKADKSSRYLDDKATTQRSIVLEKSCQTELGQNAGMFPENIDWGMQGTLPFITSIIPREFNSFGLTKFSTFI